MKFHTELTFLPLCFDRIDRKIIAVPHHDNLLPGHRFLPTNKNTGNMFGWTLTTMHVELPQSDKGYLTTPVMRGDVFAIDREYMQNIGSYDEGMGTGGGHNLELSLRAWLCGGQIRIIVCSRVAVHSTYKPQQVSVHITYKSQQVSVHITYKPQEVSVTAHTNLNR